MAINITLNKYDSNFFDRNIADASYSGKHLSLKTLSALMKDALKKARGMECQYLLFKIDEKQRFLSLALKKNNFRKCGELVDFCVNLKRIRSSLNLPKGIKMQRAGARATNAISEISKDAYRRSRLYKMPYTTKAKIDRYHSQWARNLIKGPGSFAMVAKNGHEVLGYVALRTDKLKKSCRIVLIAVKKNRRGRGVATALICGALERTKSEFNKLYVKTQADNYPAVNLYKKLGFNKCQHQYIYHNILRR